MRTPKTLLTWMQYLVFGSVILYFGRDVFIPLSFSLLIAFVVYPLCVWMERKGLGKMTAIIINIVFITVLLVALILLLTSQFNSFIDEWPKLQSKLSASFSRLSELMVTSYGISEAQQTKWIARLGDELASGVMGGIQKTISFSAFSLVMLILVPVYSILILYYRDMWVAAVQQIFTNQKKEELKEIVALVIQTYHNFIKGMGLVYLIVGVLNSIGLLILGVPHAILFGFVASILTFIPYVGILVGSLLPITMAWITYDSVWYPIGVIAIFTFVQYLEANLIFPFAVSSKLNVNTLVVLIAIFAGGVLWGVAGMILFVPFVGILKLIADHNPELKTLSIILGVKPK